MEALDGQLEPGVFTLDLTNAPGNNARDNGFFYSSRTDAVYNRSSVVADEFSKLRHHPDHPHLSVDSLSKLFPVAQFHVLASDQCLRTFFFLTSSCQYK